MNSKKAFVEITAHMHGSRYVWPLSVKSDLISGIFNLKFRRVYFRRIGAFTLSSVSVWKIKVQEFV